MKKLIYLSLVASSFLLADSQQLDIQESEHQQPIHNHETFKYLKYMPEISIISDFSYVSRDKKDRELVHLEVPGVVHGLLGEHSDGGDIHSTYNANRGLNLNYVELLLSKDINPYLSVGSTFHFSKDLIEVEELFLTSTISDYGVEIKGGKFLSCFGKINEQHHHVWSFSDMPLVK